MSLVWRKIQRSNKKAAKYKFDCQLQELTIHCGRKWQPQKVAVAWVHRRRRYVTKDHQWEPSITDPYRGIIVWPPEEPACLEVVTTLYRDSRQQTFDDKEWTFIVEGVSPRGKRKALAGISLNLRLFVNELPGTQTELQLKLKPMCEHVDLATMKLVLSCQMLKEGNALDDDMQSVASAMSVSHHKADIADLSELDNISPGESSQSMNAVFCPSPPTSPDDAQSKPSPSEIASVASEIADAWRPSRSPKRSAALTSPPAPTVPVSPPTAPLHSRAHAPLPPASGSVSRNKQEESFPSRMSWATKDVPEKITSRSPNAAPQADGLAELPSAGADLLSWCQAVTRGYRGVNVADFSKCWRNGLAFCAVIHRFKPDLIGNFDALNPENIRANCKKAFDAAATLGVPKLIDPEEMVIMVVPDKIAVTSYVYNLRAAVTGQGSLGGSASSSQHRSSLVSPWSAAVFQPEGAGRESGSTKSESPTAEDRRKSPGSVKSASSTGRFEKSPSPTDQKPLMTRNQLMNPFDSDGEDGEAVGSVVKAPRKETPSAAPSAQKQSLPTSPTSPTPVASPALSPVASLINGSDTRHSALGSHSRPSALTPLVGSSPGDRQEDLKRRARMLLQQFQTDARRSSNDALSPEDEKRRQELKERARQLMEEAQQQQPKIVKISETIASVNEELWPLRSNRPNAASSKSAPTTRQTTPEHRQYIAQSVVTKESLKNAVLEAEGGAFDRFKRFGSMRTQELTQSINFLSSRFLYQKGRRSASVPKELLSRAQNVNNEAAESNFASRKASDAPERDTRTREQILAEMEQLAQRQKILDQNAADVEKRWRKALDASAKELEQTLMNEYLSLLNERNMLTRREAYLNILEQIREQEECFHDVQSQLGELMKLEDFEKTEVHKRQIQALMEKLIVIVNRRDELEQQAIAHERGTQEAEELAENMINQSLPLAGEDQKNCIIM